MWEQKSHAREAQLITQSCDASRGYVKVLTSNTALYAFRGTNDTSDILSDFNLAPEWVFGGMVHGGFWNLASQVDTTDMFEELQAGRYCACARAGLLNQRLLVGCVGKSS